jgi:hypothetical protein
MVNQSMLFIFLSSETEFLTKTIKSVVEVYLRLIDGKALVGVVMAQIAWILLLTLAGMVTLRVGRNCKRAHPAIHPAYQSTSRHHDITNHPRSFRR